MHIERFRNEFNRLNGVYATDQVVLFRNPLELYDMKTGNVIAQFDSLEEALAFKIDGKTLEERECPAGRRLFSPLSMAAEAAAQVWALMASGPLQVTAMKRTKLQRIFLQE